MIEPLASRVPTNGIELALFEWPGSDRAAFFAHATGFHARVWDRCIEHLPGRRCLAIDIRGHGRSDKPAGPYRWAAFADDLVGVIDALGLEGAIGVGHSGGGHAITAAAAQRPHAFAALLLIDPVIGPREEYGVTFEGQHFAAKRRNAWRSPEEMIERFASRPPFDRWDPQVLRDYCTHGLLPSSDGSGFVLACPPEIEASVYAMARESDAIYDAIAAIDVPVRILRAPPRGEGEFDMSHSPTAPDLARHFRCGEDVLLAHHTHFIPMEDPGLVARHVIELADG